MTDRMGRIRVGTCSWTDPTLVNSGRFYPPKAKSAEERLGFYSQQFDLVEVDSTYYSLPAEKTACLWAERTPDGFTFDVKAFRVFTQHPTPVKSLPADMRQAISPQPRPTDNIYYRDMPPEVIDELWKRFEHSLLPLDTVGKLGIVLFQFPPWFIPGSGHLDYLLHCKDRLPQYRLAVEFRNSAWLSEGNRLKTVSFLRENNLPLVCVDEPQGFRSSVPPLAEATSDVSLVRFHGRNSQAWEKKGLSTAERFNYLYSEDELREWQPRIEKLARETGEVHVLMNNCHEDKAVVNARQIRSLLTSESRAASAE